MKYTPADIQALKSPDVMRAYAEARLDGRPVGRGYRCACPWGAHTDPLKVEITEYHGEGRATCWACGKQSARVFDLAAACSGIPNDKEHFAELMEHIAHVTGYRLTEAAPAAQGNRAPRRRASAPRTPKNAASSPTVDAPRPYVNDRAELLAFEAVDRAARTPDRVEKLAEDLRLPTHALTLRTDRALHPLGLIGLTPRGLLLFISTKWTEGRLRVTSIKSRAPKNGTAPAEVIEDGQWVTRGTLDAARKGGKFRSCTKGSGAHLWGADALADHDTAIITEGESDKLAVDLSLDAFREAWQTGLDELSQFTPEHAFPAVVSCAGAQVFKAVWAPLFRGKCVIICGDNDPAGRQGMNHTAGLLLAAGVRTVRLWHPRPGYKDAREQYRADRPADLIADIINSNN